MAALQYRPQAPPGSTRPTFAAPGLAQKAEPRRLSPAPVASQPLQRASTQHPAQRASTPGRIRSTYTEIAQARSASPSAAVWGRAAQRARLVSRAADQRLMRHSSDAALSPSPRPASPAPRPASPPSPADEAAGGSPAPVPSLATCLEEEAASAANLAVKGTSPKALTPASPGRAGSRVVQRMSSAPAARGGGAQDMPKANQRPSPRAGSPGAMRSPAGPASRPPGSPGQCSAVSSPSRPPALQSPTCGRPPRASPSNLASQGGICFSPPRRASSVVAAGPSRPLAACEQRATSAGPERRSPASRLASESPMQQRRETSAHRRSFGTPRLQHRNVSDPNFHAPPRQQSADPADPRVGGVQKAAGTPRMPHRDISDPNLRGVQKSGGTPRMPHRDISDPNLQGVQKSGSTPRMPHTDISDQNLQGVQKSGGTPRMPHRDISDLNLRSAQKSDATPPKPHREIGDPNLRGVQKPGSTPRMAHREIGDPNLHGVQKSDSGMLKQEAGTAQRQVNATSDLKLTEEAEKRLQTERLQRLEADTKEARARLQQRLQSLEQQQQQMRQQRSEERQEQGKQRQQSVERREPSQARAERMQQVPPRKPCNLAWLLLKLEVKDKDKQACAGRGAAAKRKAEAFEVDENPEILPSEIEKAGKIGAGSFGAVWKAKCRGRDVAIKICQVVKQSEMKMIQDEISYLHKLRHPRLVSFLGYVREESQVTIVMEFMPGGSLSHILFSTKAALTFERKTTMARQIAEGLAYLHDLHVVHRDLKTANVILDDSLNCKICDFGLTITLDRSHMTVWGLQGSPRYMAPEQLDANDHKPTKITEKVDIWQMGCVLLELYCLAVPFAAFSSIASIVTELIVKKRGPAIPEKADPRARVLIASCLRIRAKTRPSAEMLLEALKGTCPEESDD
eukprot:TRINITY_DN954_c0_g1_i1.p1 TRINITY_DN954_c0_g1~~TRINITY_DN954_c0_g1_i1.p1  ORF type:complete len:925 (-),score=161.11 TRINITY_DN954_c0_g1_i1:102-2831(-)